MRQWGEDLQGFIGDLALLGNRLVTQGAHVVQPVCQFDEDHPHVLAHGQEHPAQVLGVVVLLGLILDPAQFGHPGDQKGHLVPELGLDLLHGHPGVLDHVVQQAADDGGHVEFQLRQDAGHLYRMIDKLLAGVAVLTNMRPLGEIVGALQQFLVIT